MTLEATYEDRVRFHDDLDVMEIDLEGVKLTDAHAVDRLYDELERQLWRTGHKWYFLINYRDCKVFPEAWIAHAARGKKLNQSWSRGTVRYDASPETQAEIAARAASDNFDANLFGTRDAALERIGRLRETELAKERGHRHDADTIAPEDFASRVTFHTDSRIMEADFSNFAFTDSSVVDAFYDHIEHALEKTGEKWWFLVNYANCEVHPEAWIAYALRGKRVNLGWSLGTVRINPSQATAQQIANRSEADRFDANLCATRDAALARLAEMARAA